MKERSPIFYDAQRVRWRRTRRGLGTGTGLLFDLRHVPAPYFGGSIAGPLVDQIVGTGFLLLFVVAVIDVRNTAVGSNLGP